MKWLKEHWIVVAVLVAYSLIIFLPPLVHGYVYPNNGDDTAFHLRYFDTIASGNGGVAQYLGQKLVGYPLLWLSGLIGATIDSVFLWFNFIALWLVGIIAWFVVSKFVDWKAGLLVIPMVAFMTPSTLNLYDTGAVYDLITVGIVLPLVVYCFIKLWITKKWLWLLPLLVAVGFLISIHTMVLWEGMMLRNPNAENIVPTLPEFVGVFLGYTVVLTLLLSIFWLFQAKGLQIRREAKILVICLSAIVVVMCVLVFTGFMGWSARVALDVAIVLPMLVACLVGMALKDMKLAYWLVVGVFVLIASFPVASAYVGYNSAVKSLDLEAIKYVNSLEGDYYSCSPEVAPWIYDRFIDKEYKEGALPHIVRSESMTPKTNPDSKYYWWFCNTAGYWRREKTEYVQPSGYTYVGFNDVDLVIEIIEASPNPPVKIFLLPRVDGE